MNLTQAIIISISAFLVTYLLTPWARKISQKCGMVAIPNHRKMHETPVPYGGGIAIVLGFLAAFIILGAYNQQTLGFILGAFVIVVIGIFDDLKEIRALPKFLFQSVAAIVAMQAGIRINMDLVLRGHLAGLEWLSIPLTFFWIIGITNAINLIDGLDGLAAGVSTISALTISVVAFINGQMEVAYLALALGFAAMAFIPHNFKTQIFMGETGSSFLGYGLATLAIMGSVKLAAAFSLFVPVMILAIPIFDTLFAIVRRMLARQPIYVGDRAHLHHRLLEMGLTPTQTVLFIYAVSTVFAGLAIYSALVRPRVGFMIFGASLLIVFLGSVALIYVHQRVSKRKHPDHLY